MNAAVTTELKTIGHWIGGESIRGASGRKGPVYNPATGEQSGEVAFASAEEIDHAVATATTAHGEWEQRRKDEPIRDLLAWLTPKLEDLYAATHNGAVPPPLLRQPVSA